MIRRPIHWNTRRTLDDPFTDLQSIRIMTHSTTSISAFGRHRATSTLIVLTITFSFQLSSHAFSAYPAYHHHNHHHCHRSSSMAVMRLSQSSSNTNGETDQLMEADANGEGNEAPYLSPDSDVRTSMTVTTAPNTTTNATNATNATMDPILFRFNKQLIDTVYQIVCALYPVKGTNRDFARFYVLETVARVPYFAYLSVSVCYERLFVWNGYGPQRILMALLLLTFVGTSFEGNTGSTWTTRTHAYTLCAS